MHHTFRSTWSVFRPNAGRERKSAQNRSNEPSYWSRNARARRECAEAVGPEHRRHHRPVAAARLAHDPAVRRLGERAIALVDERDDLVAEVAAVAPRTRRGDELAAAERRPCVYEHDEARRRELV